MALSQLRKYKLITDKDLLQNIKALQSTVELGEYGSFTDEAEPIYYGLCLSRDMVDIAEAKRLFNEYKKTSDMGKYAEGFSMEVLTEMIGAAI